MLSPETSFEGDMIMVKSASKPPGLLRQRSSSVPDLRKLAAQEEEEEGEGDHEEEETAASPGKACDASEVSSSMVMVTGPPSVAADSTATGNSTVMVNSPWGGANSFKDAILAPSKAPASKVAPNATSAAVSFHASAASTSKPKNKFKSRIVVAPIKRCTKSSPDLRSLVNVNEEDDGGEILGFNDAHEFYARKAHGEASRFNGKKIRPDEAKRREWIINKKDAQRQQQQG
jgi:hypothetical protein